MVCRKSQTSTEYLIVLAVVIIIALIVVGVMGGIPSIGGSAKERALQAKWKVASPVAIEHWSAGKDFTVIELKNLGSETIQLNTFQLANLNFDLDKVLAGGQSYKLTVPGTYRIDQNGFMWNYTLNNAIYSKSSERPLNNSIGSNLMSGLVGYWKLDTDFKDSSPFRNDVTVSGPSNQAHIDDAALKLDGSNDMAQRSSVSWDFTNSETESFTLSAWFKNADCDGSNSLTGISIASGNDMRLYYSTSSEYYGFQLLAGTAYSRTSGCIENEWVHFVGVYSKPEKLLRLYKNGVLKDFDTTDVWSEYRGRYAYDTASNTDDITIGHAQNYYNGSIDEVMLFSRVLSASEVKSIYNTGR